MLIFACDKCKKKIKNRDSAVGISRKFEMFSFCEKCARPVSRFLASVGVGRRAEKKR
jgi:hypothetical protein